MVQQTMICLAGSFVFGNGTQQVLELPPRDPRRLDPAFFLMEYGTVASPDKR